MNQTASNLAVRTSEELHKIKDFYRHKDREQGSCTGQRIQVVTVRLLSIRGWKAFSGR